MSKKLLNIIMLLFVTMLLASCGKEPCKRECDINGEHCRKDCGEGELECVEADDWGDPKVWVPASGSELTVKGDYYNGQVVDPIDSGQVLLGESKFPLVISVSKRNQWTSWFGGEGLNPKGSDGKPDPYGWDNGRIVPNIECQYTVTNGSAPGDIKDDLAPATIWQAPKDATDFFYMGVNNEYYAATYDATGKKYAATNNPHGGEPLYANSKTPCYFRYGMGLYVGLAPDDGVGGATSSDKIIFTYHIPDAKSPDVANNPDVYFDPKTGKSECIPGTAKCNTPTVEQTEAYSKAVYDPITAPSGKVSGATANINANNKDRGMDGYLVKGLASNELPGAQTGDRLYFKILDTFYNDNEGGYLVRIREGTRSPVGGPLEVVTGLLLDPVKVIMQRIYKGIIDNQMFLQLVRAMLALYIVFYGFKFMMGVGGPQELRKEAVMRMLKIGVIMQVISPSSWAFFYDHLFGAFIDGVMQVASLLMSPFADYDPTQPWYSMDRLLAKFFSAETNAKIAATLLSNVIGVLIVIVLYGSMVLFLRALIKAVVIYIVGFIAIAILIAIAPIFIIFMLFEHTKELLKEWIGQMFAFAIQEILLMASLGMFAAVIVWFMQHTIGYKVCWNVWADFDFIGMNLSGTDSEWYKGNVKMHLWDFRFWMPDISNEMSNIWMDVDGDGVRGVNEYAYRYTDLPYFDPVFDRALIAKYMTMFNFIDLGVLLVFVGAIFLMVNFMDFIPGFSTALQGGAGSQDSSSMMVSGGSKLFNAAVSAGKQMYSGATMTARGGFKMGRFAATSRAGQRVMDKAKRGLIAGAKGLDGVISPAANNWTKAAGEDRLRLGNKHGLTKGGAGAALAAAGAPATGGVGALLKGGSGGGSAAEEAARQDYVEKEFKSKDALDVGAKTLYKTEVGTGLSSQGIKQSAEKMVDGYKDLTNTGTSAGASSAPAPRAGISTATPDFGRKLNEDANLSKATEEAAKPAPAIGSHRADALKPDADALPVPPLELKTAPAAVADLPKPDDSATNRATDAPLVKSGEPIAPPPANAAETAALLQQAKGNNVSKPSEDSSKADRPQDNYAAKSALADEQARTALLRAAEQQRQAEEKRRTEEAQRLAVENQNALAQALEAQRLATQKMLDEAAAKRQREAGELAEKQKAEADKNDLAKKAAAIKEKNINDIQGKIDAKNKQMKDLKEDDPRLVVLKKELENLGVELANEIAKKSS